MPEVFVQQRCGHCGKIVNAYAPSILLHTRKRDLDGRPVENATFRLREQISYCSECHYVAFDITKNALTDDAVLKSEEYLDIVQNTYLPAYVNSAIALGYLREKQGENREASLAYLIAAWELESLSRAREAEMLLEKVALINLQVINTMLFKRSPDLNFLLTTIDVLRRLKKFDSAKKLIEFTKSKTSNRALFKALLLEESLCDNFLATPHEISADVNSKYTNFSSLVSVIREGASSGDDFKLAAFNETARYINDSEVFACGKGVDVVVLSSDKLSVLDENFDLAKFIEGINRAYKIACGEITETAATSPTKKFDLDEEVERTVAPKEEQQEKPQPKRIEVLTSVEQLRPKAPFEETPTEEDAFIEDETSVETQEVTYAFTEEATAETEVSEEVEAEAEVPFETQAEEEPEAEAEIETKPEAEAEQPPIDEEFSVEAEDDETEADEEAEEPETIEEQGEADFDHADADEENAEEESGEADENDTADEATEESEEETAEVIVEDDEEEGEEPEISEESDETDEQEEEPIAEEKTPDDEADLEQESEEIEAEAEDEAEAPIESEPEIETEALSAEEPEEIAEEEQNAGTGFGAGFTLSFEGDEEITDDDVATLPEDASDAADGEEFTAEQEKNGELVMTVAKIEGKISISEVQALFDCGYAQAKALLDGLQTRNRLIVSDDSETYIVI